MRKNSTYLLLFLFLGLNLFSQKRIDENKSIVTFGNNWITYAQKYYKIKIGRDGIYRLDSVSLANSGIPLSSIDPQNIQLFQKGIEIYPYVAGEADGVFNTNDYILFYAEKNSGKDDSLLYDNVPYVTNPFYSVVNDTSAVFLTWNNQTNNHRLVLNTDTTYSQSTPSLYYYKESISVTNQTTYPINYSLGPLNSVNQDDPRYRLGEGFYHTQIAEGQTDTITFNTSAVYKSTQPAYFTISVSGANDIANVPFDHIVQLDYTDNSGPQILLVHDSISSYQTRRYSYIVNTLNFGANTSVRVTSLPNSSTGGISNYVNVNYMRAYYPQQFNMLNTTEEKIYLPDDVQGKSNLKLTNFGGSSTPVLIDVTNHRLLTVTPYAGKYLSIVPNSGASKFCFLSSNIYNVNKIKPVNGTGDFVNYPLLDSAYLIVSHPSLDPSVAQYKSFRSGISGGGFSVVQASINDLYDQFGYGVELDPISIRNFCHYMIANTSKPPSNLLLIGKGVHAKDCIWQGTTYAGQCLVPSWGNPSSDILITQGLPGSLSLEPAIPTGRLAAKTNQDVLAYLSKAQLHVAQTDDSLWKKRAIHFIGGNTYWEQLSLKSYMDQLKHVYQDTLIGGKVFSFYKTSTAPISTTTNDSVRQLINSGVSLITFFGHGSQSGFDQNIDDPQNYNNSPRFPLIVANSCYTGDIHSADQKSHSEVYTLAPNDHGSIGYIATVSEGVANDLFYYTQEFYKQFSYKSYTQSYGICMKNSVRQLMTDLANNMYGNDTIVKITALEMTLHGDPAIQPYTFTKPDYSITNSDVIFNTTKYADSIGLKIIMTNLGRAIKDSFTVLIQRNFPNGDTVKWYKRVKGPYYKDTLSFFIPLDYYRAVGINSFNISIDYLNFIPEITYANNSINNLILFIKGSDIEPVWPYKYAIVPNLANVTLKASTADPFAPVTVYRFQVDTNDAFQSLLVNTTVAAPGGVVTLPVTLYNKDSVVYFWRVAKDTSGTPNWKESSFQVLTGKYGWGQAHFHQFKNDGYQYVKYIKPARRFDFYDDVKTIQVNDLYCKKPWLSFTQTQFFYNNSQQRLWTCGANGWTIAVMDTISGNLTTTDTAGGSILAQTWLGTNGNCICNNVTPLTAFDFGRDNGCGDNSDWRPKLVSFINNIPVGMYVLAYSVKLDTYGDSLAIDGEPYANTMTTAMKNAFHTIGSSQIDNITDTTLLITFGKKTAGPSPGAAHEALSTNTNQVLTLVDSIKTHFNTGFIASEIIGPCMYTDTAWHSLHWHYTDLEIPSSTSHDSIVIRLIGITASGQKVTLANFGTNFLDVLDLSSYINGKQYPYIQLVAYEADNFNKTPPQLKRWQVIFDQAPEAAIHPPAGFSVVKSSVAEGETFEVHVPIKNISDFAFPDSLLVTYNLEDVNRVSHNLPYKLKRKPFLPDSVIMDTIRVNTLGFSGNDILWIDVNPPGKPKYQPEQFHFNNIAEIAFNVNRDKINPMLDVTFDGVHILNGDIVSAKPNVLVSLKDENKFLALNDTSNFKVYLMHPGSSSETRLYFSSTLQFIPAQLPNNSCKINYHPVLTQDGVYTLHVISSDRSGNISGQFDYRIQFDVINKPSITEVLNYPNPFSTSTKFVFTITGSEVPETFKIQILTITGRVVKEVTREELGFLHVGRNITDYAWDGTDQFGDKLANGVYLYRVQTRLHGDEVDHLSTAADSYFKKGFGKMLLMR